MITLTLAGDVFWILALSVMASASRLAWRRMDAETRVPMQFALNGKPTWRAKRNFALCLFPTVAFLVGLLLVVFNRNLGASPDQAMILFGVRAAVAPLLAVVHLRWLKEALAVLADEGQLRP